MENQMFLQFFGAWRHSFDDGRYPRKTPNAQCVLLSQYGLGLDEHVTHKEEAKFEFAYSILHDDATMLFFLMPQAYNFAIEKSHYSYDNQKE